MALDPELVCSDCRRFWHGPPGMLPFPSPRGVYCQNPRHAKPPPSPSLEPVYFDWHKRLSINEVDVAYERGLRRHDNARRVGRPGRYGNANDAESRHYDGMAAVAEKQAANTTGRVWLGADLLVPDRGEDVEGLSVKWTHYPYGFCPVHPDDRDDLPTVLFVGEDRYALSCRGWILAGDAKRPEWWRTDIRHPCFGAPQNFLVYDPPPPIERTPDGTGLLL